MSWQDAIPNPGALAVVQRNFGVWRKLLLPSMLGNFGDPLLYLLALGYGLGHFVGHMDGMPYITFIASGIVASSVMNTASFEGLYSAFTRMSAQHTYAAMLATPLRVSDILAGEVLWAAIKGLISAIAIIIVASFFGAIQGPWVWLSIPVILLSGLSFGSLALVMTAMARSYDFFMYYFTLAVTPMFLFCGVFYPLHSLPAFAQDIAQVLPLTHAVALMRPLLTGQLPRQVPYHLGVLLLYTVIPYLIAWRLLVRRLLR
ncbi:MULTISPECIES: ABC transporter permease [Acidithiobacillus]|jgi:lipooligosaccharide transport system permease protein|uniref:Transport permease protein n=2 Tax=Acidithiobacillus thiooxidans TaxID=930 RepID=A0A1C2JBM7_ACITH|nr:MULTISPECIES: ABC transporter permease [Acidithiobacillus]MDX5933751.1 ABC transporter permease [Acidithiobacillus thiooxidans]OCX69208.1 nodulation protein NodJ [Acidithiobacillus thiooxidans]OCX79984.1 nodulation protein NodJ [Acidithiobacillus thiooxidans]OCX85632.1 nodulation protein NodJ [Acidithiobacillus thiooxidans]OCX85737.1 nodulation protein NodJ [Acidithiobacillus thiooxidans]